MEKIKIENRFTDHYMRDNANRENCIQTNCGGDGMAIAKYYVDKGHQNGEEWHYVTDHAIIIIVNVNTDLICTKLIARPNQITRYAHLRNELTPKTKKMRNFIIPNNVINLAAMHERKGYNHL